MRTDVGTAFITLIGSPVTEVLITIGKPGTPLRAMSSALEATVNRLLSIGVSREEIAKLLDGRKTSSGITSLPEAVARVLMEDKDEETDET